VRDAGRALEQMYERSAAQRRLARDVERMPRPPVLRRPRINTFVPYDPGLPLKWDHQVSRGATPYVDAPAGESFWLLLIGAFVFVFFGWLAWMVNAV